MSEIKKAIVSILVITLVLLAWSFLSFKVGILQGIKIGRSQITIEDVCVDPEQGGMSANFQTGEYYETIKCKINIRHDIKVQDVFEFEGDWDKCDDDIENCEPFVRDGKVINE